MCIYVLTKTVKKRKSYLYSVDNMIQILMIQMPILVISSLVFSGKKNTFG